MNIPQKSRLEGLHRRHHEKKGIKKPGCSFCELPSLGVRKDAQKSIVVAEPDHYEALVKEAERNVEKSLERDRMFSCATAGLTLMEAAEVTDMPLQLFIGLTEAHFKKPWAAVVSQARLSMKRDLTEAAIKAAKEGDSRLLIRLSDKGLFDSLLADERQQGLRDVSTIELEERLKQYLKPASIADKVPQSGLSLKVPQSGLSLEETTQEDCHAFEATEPAISIQAAMPIPEPIEELVKVESAEVRPVEPIEPVIQVETQKPVVYEPPPAFPLQPTIRRSDL